MFSDRAMFAKKPSHATVLANLRISRGLETHSRHVWVCRYLDRNGIAEGSLDHAPGAGSGQGPSCRLCNKALKPDGIDFDQIVLDFEGWGRARER